MELSLRLLRDPRYTQIEEAIQNAETVPNVKNRVWQEVREEFIDDMYQKYSAYIKTASVEKRCPVTQSRLKFIQRN